MTPLFTLLLGGCSLLGFNGGNSMSTRGGAPFSLGKVTSALWVESAWSDPADGNGEGILLLTTADMSCDDLMAELDGEIPTAESVVYTSSGIVIQFEWWDPNDRDVGFEGSYMSGLYPIGYDYGQDAKTWRVFELAAFADGTTWNDYYGLGAAEITDHGDGGVIGTVQTTWVKASFDAEHCGQQEGYVYDDYDYWYYDDY